MSALSRNLSKSSWQLPYMPGLDGLRAIAVIAVLLYHADLTWMPGGFLGVESFFVLSGYLITSLLFAEWCATGSIDLKDFWMRRARRLLPAFFLLIAAVLTYAVAFLPDEVADLRGETIAATGYVSNWYLIFSQQSYFAAVGRPSLLRHLWSLAVEGQFYLLWPLLFVVAMLRWQPRRVLVALLAAATLSAVLMAMLFRPELDPSRVYFGTDTRAAGLLIGAALALVWIPGQLKDRATRLPFDLIGFCALCALALLYMRINEFQPFLYQGGFALVAITTAVVIAAAVHPRARFFPALLSWRPIRWIGSRSYGIYLWHWPVFMVTRPQLDVAIGGMSLLVVRFALTCALAELSYRFIEAPVRAGALGRSWQALREASGSRRQRLGAGWGTAAAASVVFFSVLGHSVVGAQPPPPPAYLSVDRIDGIISIEASGHSVEPTAELSRPLPGTPVVTARATDAPTPESVATTQAVAPMLEVTATPSTTSTVRLATLPKPRSTAPTRQLEDNAAAATDLTIHIVRRGEDLFHISQRYGTAVEVVAAANELKPADRITVGQRLFIPLRTAATPSMGRTITPASREWVTHIVKRGEDLFRISQRYDTTVDAIASANRIGQRDRLSVGQRLSVPMPLSANRTVSNSTETADATTAAPSAPPTPSPPSNVSTTLIEPSQLDAPAAAATRPVEGPSEAADEKPAAFSRVTAVGDSVMLGAVNQLATAVGDLYIDAQLSRQASDVVRVLQARQAAGLLGPTVIVHVGNNGIIRADQVDAMMQTLAGADRVVFVNVKLPRRWEGPNNVVLAEKVQQYPNAVLVDWYAASVNRPDLFWNDGIHLRPEGAQVYAALIAAALQ